MRKVLMCGAVAAALSAGGVEAQTGQLAISGTSTVRSWTCKAGEFETAVRPASNLERVLRGEKAVSSVTFTVPVADIDCGNGKMEEHLRKALKSDRFPNVTYELSTYELSTMAEGMTVQAVGQVTIAGSTKPVEMQVSMARAENGDIRVKGETPLTMTAFGVQPPTLMLGTLKVGDAIRISFDIPLNAAASRIVANGR